MGDVECHRLHSCVRNQYIIRLHPTSFLASAKFPTLFMYVSLNVAYIVNGCHSFSLAPNKSEPSPQ